MRPCLKANSLVKTSYPASESLRLGANKGYSGELFVCMHVCMYGCVCVYAQGEGREDKLNLIYSFIQ